MIEIKEITARDNKKLKLLRSAATKKGREKYGAYLVEGKRMVDEAVRYAKVLFVALSESYAEHNARFTDELLSRGIPVYLLKDRLFSDVSETVSPQGIAAAVSLPKPSCVSPDDRRLLILDGVSEPGNMGTIIRTAEAAGIDRIVLMKGCADVYNPKVVRSTMGSIFRMKFVYLDGYAEIGRLKNDGFRIVVSTLEESVDLYDFRREMSGRIDSKLAMVIGSEAFGVSREMTGYADIRIRIPMSGAVESLNAAVAAGILMYTLPAR